VRTSRVATARLLVRPAATTVGNCRRLSRRLLQTVLRRRHDARRRGCASKAGADERLHRSDSRLGRHLTRQTRPRRLRLVAFCHTQQKIRRYDRIRRQLTSYSVDLPHETKKMRKKISKKVNTVADLFKRQRLDTRHSTVYSGEKL